MLEGSCHCGAVTWRFDGAPESATACNCTICRRYGALWIYGHEGADVSISGDAAAYQRGRMLTYHFCPKCGCIAAWRGLQPEADGRRRMAVNVRLADPAKVAALLIDHFDGLDTFDDLPRDGRTVADYWF
ncbi:MAG: GFA family protein [Hyphomicrobium sp.]